MGTSSISARLRDMIILDNVLKIRVELIKQRNDNAGEKLYLVQAFSKVRNLVEISKNSKNLEFLEILSREARLVYELSEREPGWRFTARCHTKTIAKRARVEPHTQMHMNMKMFFYIC